MLTQGVLVWALIGLAFVAANLPFLNQRLMALLPLKSGRKALVLRLAEVLGWYAVVGMLGLLFESRLGGVARQGWEFYAVSLFLFLTFAFPGFVYCYLVRRD